MLSFQAIWIDLEFWLLGPIKRRRSGADAPHQSEEERLSSLISKLGDQVRALGHYCRQSAGCNGFHSSAVPTAGDAH